MNEGNFMVNKIILKFPTNIIIHYGTDGALLNSKFAKLILIFC